jgi:putative FmdB family regulatory protein
MPVYDYKCLEHGIFNDLATIEDSAKPKACPKCGTLCGRVIIMPSNILNMDENKRHAMETNERSQHEPTFSSKERRADDEEHAKGCGCSKHKPGKSNLMFTAQGDKMFPSMRPWMISH